MYCNHCGKEITEETVFCPDCGTRQEKAAAESQKGQTKASTNTMCLIGFVIAIISLLINFWGIVGIVATIVSVLGLQACGRTGEKGKGLAIAGICIGAASILWGCISLLVLSGIF